MLLVLRRAGAGPLVLMAIAGMIILVSRTLFCLMLIASIGMPEY